MNDHFMHKIIYLSLALLFHLIIAGQTPKTVSLADSLILPGNFKATITSYEFPKEIKMLQEKALNNLKKDTQWSDRYIVGLMLEGDKYIKYMDAYGLTRQEFDKMIDGFKAGQDIVLTDTAAITIKKINGIISFQCAGKIELFKYLTIDTRNKSILFDNFKVTKELEVKGKYYAPTLTGWEAHSSVQAAPGSKQKDVAYFGGFTIGINKRDTRPALCLIYGKPGKIIARPEYLIITIM